MIPLIETSDKPKKEPRDPMTTIKIYENEFEVPDPYAAGHSITEIEAKVLNRCFAENIANNQRKHIKEALDGAGITPEVQKAFAEYAGAYQFTEAAAGSSRATMTPLEREAKRIATALVNKHLRATNRKKADVDKDDYDAQVAKVAASDKVQKAAKRRVKEDEEMDELELS